MEDKIIDVEYTEVTTPEETIPTETPVLEEEPATLIIN